jgi:NCAIR mutase (PurE)-related protein
VALDLEATLRALASGALTPEEAARRIRALGFVDLGFAKVDVDRERRTGLPEVVLAAGKEPEDAVAIAARLLERHGRVLLTRVPRRTLARLEAWRPGWRWNRWARTAWRDERGDRPPAVGHVLVVTAGTSDRPVAEEVLETLAFCGSAASRLEDVGVAGLHRLLAHVDALRAARVVVVVAGMEGALPSVVTGLTDRPVVAVPTSRGYGVSRGGWAALGTMLASCAPGMAVVNVDNGFGAAVLAHRINALAGPEPA